MSRQGPSRGCKWLINGDSGDDTEIIELREKNDSEGQFAQEDSRCKRRLEKTSKRHDSFSVEHITVVLYDVYSSIGISFFCVQEKAKGHCCSRISGMNVSKTAQQFFPSGD